MCKYAKDTEGVIHAICPFDREYTICGNAMEGDIHNNNEASWKKVKKGVVNCMICIAIIKGLKGIKYEGEK